MRVRSRRLFIAPLYYSERVTMASKNADRQFMLEFMEVYHSLPALWDIKCKDCTNRGKKNEQYDVLIEKYRENFPDADKQEVIKKVNSLRTNFRKELKMIRDAEKSGVGAEDVEPSLWYSEEMRFLQNLETPTTSMNTMNDSGHSPCDNPGNENSDEIDVSTSRFLISIKFNISEIIRLGQSQLVE